MKAFLPSSRNIKNVKQLMIFEGALSYHYCHYGEILLIVMTRLFCEVATRADHCCHHHYKHDHHQSPSSLFTIIYMIIILIVILCQMTGLFHEVTTRADVLIQLTNQLLHSHLCKNISKLCQVMKYFLISDLCLLGEAW